MPVIGSDNRLPLNDVFHSERIPELRVICIDCVFSNRLGTGTAADSSKRPVGRALRVPNEAGAWNKKGPVLAKGWQAVDVALCNIMTGGL
jgi:hypothetical protein